MFRQWRYSKQMDLGSSGEDDSDDDDDDDEDEATDLESDAEGASGSGGPGRAYVRIIGHDVDLDDHHATIVFVFPRSKLMNGKIDPDEEVKNPAEKAAAIFRNEKPGGMFLESFPSGKSGVMNQRRFQRLIRERFLHLLVHMEFQLKTFESIDGDETYLTVTVEDDAEILKKLARCFRYQLPFNKDAYESMKPFAGFPGGQPPRNYGGEEVYAFHDYNDQLRECFQPFRDVDKIRLLLRICSQHVNLAEMETQGVISRFFIAAKYDQIRTLHSKWVASVRFTSRKEEDLIRDYFGEEVAYFFQYYAYYIKTLGALSALVLVITAIDIYKHNLMMHSCLKIAFGGCVVIWATHTQDSFEHKACRSRQKWGMDDAATTVEPTLHTYRPELEGTKRLWLQKWFSNACVVVACLLFSLLWGIVSVKGRGTWESIGTTILIRVFSICWGMVVPGLVRLHNHRTQRRHNKSMVAKLGLVKLFLYLSPFLRTAFVVNWSQMTCGQTIEEAADIAFAGGWPSGVEKEKFREWLPEYIVPLNRKLHRRVLGVPESAKECIWGCKPKTCIRDPGRGTAGCRTNCYYTLRESLNLLYISHVGFSLIFVSIAIVLTRFRARREIKRSTEASKRYTWLQFQAKCDEVAKYEYASWGGSYVEDFLEVVLSFAMVSCFGIMQPWLAVLAFAAAAVECRVVAYRMTHVTSRPYPVSAQGIEMWQRLIGLVVILSVIVNAGLAVFLLPPFDRWPPGRKVLMFFAYGYIMYFGRCMVQSTFHRRPTDVARINDFNDEFLAKVNREYIAPQTSKQIEDEGEKRPSDLRAFDVGLEPSGYVFPIGVQPSSWSHDQELFEQQWRRSFSLFGEG